MEINNTNLGNFMDIYKSEGNQSLDFSNTTGIRNSSRGFGNTEPLGMSSDLVQLGIILSRCFTSVLGATGLLLNGLVFGATTKTSPQTLKSKTLILNAILADMALALGSCVPTILYILSTYRAESVRLVLAALNAHLFPGMVYVQVFATVVLACDRMYAVLRPLTYHTVGYNAAAKVLLASLPWTLATVLILPGFIIPFVGDRFTKRPLHVRLNYGFQQFTDGARQYITIGANVAVFLLYAVIFVALELTRRYNRVLGSSGCAYGGTTLSLTLTYFIIHVSSLCLYLPGPVFLMLRKTMPPSVLRNGLRSLINRTLFNLYILNTVVNPIILGYRVRTIRQYLSPILSARKTTNRSRLTSSISLTDKH